ncbi:hypothetical protein ACFTZI_10670 [Streptomyces decoyicus]|uniref:hypothetical protein n=1 Tax=Streptomyces decoyicus TaxID=249567 RepID=UPI0036455492
MLQENAQELIDGLEAGTANLGDALGTTVTLAEAHCLMDPRAAIFPTWGAWVNAMQVGSALFAAATNGVPIHEVSRWMGHSSIKITVDRYGHLTLDGSDRCRQVIEATYGVHMLSGFPAPRELGAELVLA